MASVSEDTTIKIWIKNEDNDGKNLYNLMTTLSGYHHRAVYSCSWNYDGTLLATVMNNEYVFQNIRFNKAGADNQVNIFRLKESYSSDELSSFEMLESIVFYMLKFL